MELAAQFQESVAAGKALPTRPDNDTLLKIYSLYKQATSGDAPPEGDYGMFDFVAKAKHEAWKQYSGLPKEDAMRQYIDLIASLQKQQQ